MTEQIVLDRFKVIKELGKGAQAVTYKAIDLSDGTVKVLKKYNLAFSDIKKIKDETKLLAHKLDHPNIMKSFELIQENDDFAWQVNEFIDGDSLDVFIRKQFKEVR